MIELLHVRFPTTYSNKNRHGITWSDFNQIGWQLLVKHFEQLDIIKWSMLSLLGISQQTNNLPYHIYLFLYIRLQVSIKTIRFLRPLYDLYLWRLPSLFTFPIASVYLRRTPGTGQTKITRWVLSVIDFRSFITIEK